MIISFFMHIFQGSDSDYSGEEDEDDLEEEESDSGNSEILIFRYNKMYFLSFRRVRKFRIG